MFRVRTVSGFQLVTSTWKHAPGSIALTHNLRTLGTRKAFFLGVAVAQKSMFGVRGSGWRGG
eukprot:1992229-Rhodomonas_salina.2